MRRGERRVEDFPPGTGGACRPLATGWGSADDDPFARSDVKDTRPLLQLSRIAVVVASFDLATKAVAERALRDTTPTFESAVGFALVHNAQGAFGWTAGAYTWQVNFALTLAAIAFMLPVSRELARADRAAPLALGLILGGALGNLVSMLTSPAGVVDFLALNFDSWGVVLNVADVAAYVGLAMILRTGYLLATAIRRQSRETARGSLVPLSAVGGGRAAAVGFGEVERSSRPALHRDLEVTVADWSDLTRPMSIAGDFPTVATREPLAAQPLRPEPAAEITRPLSVSPALDAEASRVPPPA